MGRICLLFLLTLAAQLRAQDDLKLHKCRPLQFELGVPAGWDAQQDLTGMVARTRGSGFMVTREPFLGVDKDFAEVWGKQLNAAGISTRVKVSRAGRLTAYQAAWTAEDAERFIEVWRIHAPINEMLYNFSFSAKNQEDLAPLVEKVLRSFKVTAPKPSLKFQREKLSLGAILGGSFKVPVDYVPRGVRLGGRSETGFIKSLPGYAKPHQAGVIVLSRVRPGQTKKIAAQLWDAESVNYDKPLKKPRTKSAKFSGIKGHLLIAHVMTKDGKPKMFGVFAGRRPQSVLRIAVIVDAREARMYGDYLKLVCSQLKIEK